SQPAGVQLPAGGPRLRRPHRHRTPPGPAEPEPGEPGPAEPEPVEPGPAEPGPPESGSADPGPGEPGSEPRPREPGPAEPRRRNAERAGRRGRAAGGRSPAGDPADHDDPCRGAARGRGAGGRRT